MHTAAGARFVGLMSYCDLHGHFFTPRLGPVQQRRPDDSADDRRARYVATMVLVRSFRVAPTADQYVEDRLAVILILSSRPLYLYPSE